MRIGILFTCYNRCVKTVNCIRSIKAAAGYARANGIETELRWYITDAGSDDDTVELIRNEIEADKLKLRIEGSDTFYSNGMRKCMEMASVSDDIDFIMLINDDVDFYEDFLYRMISGALSDYKEMAASGSILIGACDDGEGRATYGGNRYNSLPIDYNSHIRGKLRKISYHRVSIGDDNKLCHTFNANCVLIPYVIFKAVGLMDESYVHSLGDFDYGMMIWEKGYKLLTTDCYVGKCLNNPKEGTWMDRSLSRIERIRALNSVKGAPTNKWFYYLNKHFGCMTAVVYSLSPYVRIILGK